MKDQIQLVMQKLVKLQEDADITHAEMSCLLNVPKGTWLKWYTGERQPNSAAYITLVVIHNVLYNDYHSHGYKGVKLYIEAHEYKKQHLYPANAYDFV